MVVASECANLGSIGHELKVIGCLGIYCWFVSALGV